MARPLAILVALALLPLARQATAQGWVPESSPTAQNLYGVAFSDADTSVAVGGGGAIVRSTDAGVSWTSIASPVGDALRGIAFHGNIGLAVGIGGRVLRTVDAGRNWTIQSRPTTKALYAVSMGDSMAVVTGEEGGIFVSLDDGLTWHQRFAGTASVLFGVSVNGDYGVGVGGAGAVVMTTDRGTGWGLTVLGDALTFFYATSFPTPATGWAVGANVSPGNLILRSDLYGFTWAGQAPPAPNSLFGVSFPTADTGTAVGAAGMIVHTPDGGADWAVQSSGVTQTLNAVSFPDSHLGLAVGDAGTILRTETGGLTAVGPGPDIAPRLRLAVLGNPMPPQGGTTFAFDLPRDAPVSLEVFGASGRRVAVLANGPLGAGRHQVAWQGVDASGAKARPGVYFAELTAGTGTARAKFVILR